MEHEQPTDEGHAIYADFYTAVVTASKKHNLKANETLAYLSALIGNVLGAAYPEGPRSIVRAMVARNIDIAAAVSGLAVTPAVGNG